MQIKFYICAAVIAASFASGWLVNGWRMDAVLLAQKEEAERARIALAQDNADLIEEASNVEQQTRIEYRDRIKTVYRTVERTACLDADGVRQWNEASGYADKPDDKLPADGTP